MKKIGNTDQICSAVRSVITDGRASGVRIITIANGKLNLVLSESNALDVLRLWHEGDNVGFVSKAGLYGPDNEDFRHSFPAGMVYTCGLDAIGGVPGHYPHGRLHRTPAEIIEFKVDEKGIKIVAVVKDAALFGSNLVLTRTFEAKAFAEEFTITDRIENRAFQDEKYCLLYHINVGWPFVDEGAKIVGNFKRTIPRNDWAEKCKDKMLVVESPVDKWEENCFFHETTDGELALENPKLGKRFTVKSNLKKFVQWKSRASGDYVIGLEPGTSWLDDKLTYSTLKPGKSATIKLSLKVNRL